MTNLIPIAKLKELSNYRDRRSIQDWLGKFGVAFFRIGRNYFAIKDEFEGVILMPIAKYLLEKYNIKTGNEFPSMDVNLSTADSGKNQLLEKADKIKVNLAIGGNEYQTERFGLENPAWICMMRAMAKDDEIIQIPANLESPGFFIKCQECRTWISKNQCRKTGRHISLCPNQSKLQYISAIQVPNDTRREVRVLGRNIHKAFELYAKHRAEVKGGKTEIKEKQQNPIETKKISPNISIERLMDKYLGHIERLGVPEHRKKKILTKKHREEIKRVLKKYFYGCLRGNGIEVEKDGLENINDAIAVEFHKQLESMGISGPTYNKYMSITQTFFSFLVREKFAQNNPFAGFVRKDERGKEPVIISEEQLHRLLQEFNNKDSEYGKQVYPTETKNLWRDWLADATLLGILTGRRLSELFFMKWSDIQEENGVPVRIEVVDLKGTRLKQSPNALPKKVYPPITKELYQLLEKLGFNEKQGKNEYILCPNEKATRENLAIHASRAFSYYSRGLFGSDHPTFHALRRTYTTKLSKAIGPDKARIILGWRSANIPQDHYISAQSMSSEAKDFTVFGNEKHRMQELSKIRSKKLRQQNTLER